MQDRVRLIHRLLLAEELPARIAAVKRNGGKSGLNFKSRMVRCTYLPSIQCPKPYTMQFCWV